MNAVFDEALGLKNSLQVPDSVMNCLCDTGEDVEEALGRQVAMVVAFALAVADIVELEIVAILRVGVADGHDNKTALLDCMDCSTVGEVDIAAQLADLASLLASPQLDMVAAQEVVGVAGRSSVASEGRDAEIVV